jgi:SP family sugar:H+ symporter-like MFS transporter
MTHTASEPIEAAGPERVNMSFVLAIVAVATIGGFMFGYDSGVINGTQEGLERAFQLTSFGTGVNVAAILIGCAVGAYAAGRMADVLGRRTVMILAAILFILSALVAGAAPSSAIFVVARFVGGLGVGAASVLAPVYISEVTPAKIRGRLSSIQQIMIITGLTAAFVVNWVLAKVAGGSTVELFGHPAWRWMFWVQTIPAAVFLVSLLTIPESPRFLVARGREAEAGRVLARLLGEEAAPRKVVEIRDSLARDHHQPKLADLYDKSARKIRPIVWVGIGLAVFQQLVGINIIFYYGAVLWRSVGFTENDALQTNVLSGVLSILACFVAVGLIDRIGRKPLLLIGSAGMTITLLLVAYAFSTAQVHDGQVGLPHSMGLLALFSANAYVVLFNLSWGPVMWVMLGEMFPNQIRGPGLAVAGGAQWLANFLITASFPVMQASLGLVVTYGFYALSALVSFVFVRKLVHETRGRELEDMVG